MAKFRCCQLKASTGDRRSAHRRPSCTSLRSMRGSWRHSWLAGRLVQRALHACLLCAVGPCVYHCVCCSTDPRPCAPGDYELLQPKTASPCSFARRPRHHFRLLTLVQVLDIDSLWKFHMQLSAKLDVLCYQRGERLASARAQALYMVIDMLRKKAAVARGARPRGAYRVRAGV